jgi:hypothetical protein
VAGNFVGVSLWTGFAACLDVLHPLTANNKVNVVIIIMTIFENTFSIVLQIY